MKTRLLVEVGCGAKTCEKCGMRLAGDPYMRCITFDLTVLRPLDDQVLRLPQCLAAQREVELMDGYMKAAEDGNQFAMSVLGSELDEVRAERKERP